jgi:DNA helicase-2/ATP-dependent DNA helicase PcrA
MVPLEAFLTSLPPAINLQLNTAQQQAVAAPSSQSLHLVAGPGTGKTAVLVLRMLRLIFVDGLPPHAILATTFTRKAAVELRSRLLSWGTALVQFLQSSPSLVVSARSPLSALDFSHVPIGTLDSFCEQLLSQHRTPRSPPPILADEFTLATLLMQAIFHDRHDLDADFRNFLEQLCGPGDHSQTAASIRDLILAISDRRHYDLVNWEQFLQAGSHGDKPAAGNPRLTLDSILRHYQQSLADRGLLDFPTLEKQFLDRLLHPPLPPLLQPLQAILIDEYQDTNLLQEHIYFLLSRTTTAPLTVVGDDDQSLYRFRGATVELFRDFPQRHTEALGTRPLQIFLNENHRSTAPIIHFVNQFAVLDSRFQPARAPNKPPLLLPRRRPQDVPVLAIFRDTPQSLANSLAQFLISITHGPGFTINGRTIRIDHAAGGNIGDCALLCSSPNEYSNGPNSRKRFPLLLRESLARCSPSIPVYNPRGQNLSQVPAVQRLGGLLLECLDPAARLQQQLDQLPENTITVLNTWRTAASSLLTLPNSPPALRAFVDGWARRDPGRTGVCWPHSVHGLELLSALVHWLPELHNSPAGQIWLEVFTRQFTVASQLSRFRGRILTQPDNPHLSDKSALHLLRYVLLPIAGDHVSPDESLTENLPHDCLNILSIHQSKGLEFPLVIVDIGADLLNPRPANAFKRFPAQPATPHNLEDLLRPHSPLEKVVRKGTDRAFDDLYRQYFVAFSRPRNVLLLAGLNTVRPGGRIPSIASGCDRTGHNHWQKRPWLEI